MRAIINSCLLVLASISTWQGGVCGVPKLYPDYRICGGTPANITEVPYMAVYRLKGERWGCGAVIVHEQFLLTAAHCEVLFPGEKYITVGTDKIDEGEHYEIEKIAMHPQYYYYEYDYDLLVIKLKKKLVLSKRVKLIEMADSTLVPKPGDQMLTIGFGTFESNKHSKTLLKATLAHVDKNKCQEAYNAPGILLTDRMTCAGGEKGIGTRSGDSGSPLVYKGKLYGLTAFGLAEYCTSNASPDGFSNVPSMRVFIDYTIKHL